MVYNVSGNLGNGSCPLLEKEKIPKTGGYAVKEIKERGKRL